MRYRFVAGIDPGANGAIAILDTDLGLIDILQPTAIILGGYSAYEYSFDADRETICVVEHQAPHRGSGSLKSAMGLGVGFGYLLAQIGDLDCVSVRPQIWRQRIAKFCGLEEAPKGKDWVMDFAESCGVNLIPKGKRVRQDGIADAFCIALSYLDDPGSFLALRRI